MISPEVWSLKAPQHLFSFTDACDYNKAYDVIDNHFFNHSVTIVLPDTVLVPEDLNTVLVTDSVYYKVNQLPLRTFLDRQFIDAFVKSGYLSGVSLGSRLDTDDCAAVTPSGHLVLKLTKETYQLLGLEGSQSKFSSDRYVVQIDLKNSSFVPGKKNYIRTIKCLTEFVDLQMDFLISWEPPDKGDNNRLICPSSIAAYFNHLGFTVDACSPQAESKRHYGVQLPTYDSTSHHELLEWIGAVALCVDTSSDDPESRYKSDYRGPQEDTRETQVAVLKYFGFFTSFQINRLFKTFRCYIEGRKDIPWGCMHVQGFADSPVSWLLQEHMFHSNGDNWYTILLQPDNTLNVFRANTCSAKYKLRT